MYPWPLVKRVKRCRDKLTGWLSTNFPETKATLRRGASEADLQEVEEGLKVKLPLPTRILYRFHDGQEIMDNDPTPTSLGASVGLIGGYSFYGHLVNVYLLSLSQVVQETSHIVCHLGFATRSQYIVVAASCTSGEKLFFLDCRDGQLYVGTRNFPTDGEMMPCVPNGLLKSVHDLNSHQWQDAMLLSPEEHGRWLQSGIIKVYDEGNFRGISQFPEETPHCMTAITKGVRIRGSAVFVPEFADLQDAKETFLFSYSIRMSLLPEGCFINGIYFNSCQLHWRSWIFCANDAVVDDF